MKKNVLRLMLLVTALCISLVFGLFNPNDQLFQVLILPLILVSNLVIVYALWMRGG